MNKPIIRHDGSLNYEEIRRVVQVGINRKWISFEKPIRPSAIVMAAQRANTEELNRLRQCFLDAGFPGHVVSGMSRAALLDMAKRHNLRV